jgi:hypothetical protein
MGTPDLFLPRKPQICEDIFVVDEPSSLLLTQWLTAINSPTVG